MVQTDGGPRAVGGAPYRLHSEGRGGVRIDRGLWVVGAGVL